MNSTEKTSKPTEIEEPTTVKMILFSMGYFLNGFLIVAFGSFVWHFYEVELGLINIINLWPLYLWIVYVIFTLFSMVTNPIIGYLTGKPRNWTRKRGFHTPWVIIGGVPTVIFFFLIFTPPKVTGNESVFPILFYFLIFVLYQYFE